MEPEKLIYLLKNPSLVAASDVSTLESDIATYPYFQAPRALQLKALKDSGSFIYNYKLKETAAYTTDREVLFDFISSNQFSANTTTAQEIAVVEKEEELIEGKVEFIPNKTPNNVAQATSKTLLKSVDKKEENNSKHIHLEPQAPLEFSKNETHSFAEWLKLTTINPIVREEKKRKKRKFIESPLINNFLKNNPKIPPIKKTTQISNLAVKSTVSSDDLMTETLAKVYLAQGNYKKAIQAYKILSLKNPEKSGLFADQIRAIKKLQDNNK